jgi:RDD family
MAVYDPPQPLWKRNLAAIFDFILAATVFALIFYHFFPEHRSVAAPQVVGRTEIYSIGPATTLVLLALVIAYFIILGRTGGTVFQRLFGMKRMR